MSECPTCGPTELIPAAPMLDGTPVLMCLHCHRINTVQAWAYAAALTDLTGGENHER